MKRIVLIALVLTSTICRAQNKCDCKSELEFVIDYYQKNLPGFKDNVSETNLKEYNNLKKELLKESEIIVDEVACFKIITWYVEFFRDNHSGIRMYMPNVNDANPTELNDFLESDRFKNREVYDFKEEDLKQYPLDDIRGLYTLANGAYVIAVVPSKTNLRDYIGVIVESKTKLWKRGQVKLEIKLTEDKSNKGFVYLKNHSLRYMNKFPLHNGVLGDSWFKTSKEAFVNVALNRSSDFEVKTLNDNTTYLRIPTFSGSSSAKIKQLYDKAKPLIETLPYLIIDVRDNGGGSDDNVMPLLEYMYTNPIETDKVDLYVTEDNIKVWESWYQQIEPDTINYSKEMKTWFVNEIDRMKKADVNSYLIRSESTTFEIEPNANSPKKIVIIQNRNCASSCETLLFWAKQSKKTVLVGENSGGYVGYGEVGSIETPCFKFELSCTMTRYEEQRKYELIGITPDHQFNYKTDWITQAMKLLD